MHGKIGPESLNNAVYSYFGVNNFKINFVRIFLKIIGFKSFLWHL